MTTTLSNPYTLHTLGNGLRVVIETMPDVRSAAAGFMVLTGARDDPPPLAGVAHFLEHMMFKGTPNRTWRDITVEFDRMGSSYNAFTSEDRTVYYGWVRQGEIERQIELLADMLRSTLPVEEFTTEKKVVLEEIAMSKDNLDHVAFDFLQEKVFAGHPLGWPILGYRETIEAMERDQMWGYFQERYAPGNVMLIVAGNVVPEEIIDVAEKLCGDWPATKAGNGRKPPQLQTGTDVRVVERFKQQVVALTYPAVGTTDPRAEIAGTAATILGGDNSRFYWNIVQKGIAPSAGAHYLEYTDCGAMVLYGTCQPENAERLLESMRTEANRICTEPPKPHEVERVKNKRRTSLAVEGEVPYHRLTQLMDDMQSRGAPRTVEQMLAEVDAITPEAIAEYFAAFPINTGGHLTSVGPRKWPE